MNENSYGGFQDGADLDAVRQQVQTPLYRHVAKTYGWMFLGLLLTFVTSFLLYATGWCCSSLSPPGCPSRC